MKENWKDKTTESWKKRGEKGQEVGRIMKEGKNDEMKRDWKKGRAGREEQLKIKKEYGLEAYK